MTIDRTGGVFRPASLAVAAALVATTATLALVAPPARADSDPKAVAVADHVMKALGGQDEWKKARYLRWDFAVDRNGKTLMTRSHTWDRWTGRYRVEAKNQEGQAVVVLMNLRTKEGKAWVDGKPATGEALNKLLESGYAWWTNDSYWLLMPYKMQDPGVNLSYVREEGKGDAACDVVLLTFDGVGLTPKDKYWVHVNRKTGLVDRWDYVLKGEKTDPSRFDWKGWKMHGDIRLADDRVSPNGTRIHFPVLDVPATVADSVFTQP